MKKNYSKLIIPTIYVVVIALMLISTVMILNGINNFINEEKNYNYTLNNVFEEEIEPVVGIESTEIIRPYISEEVKIGKYFYDFESDLAKQENSIVYFENTYMQNSGVDYISDESFDVVSILEGEVLSIEQNEIFGTILTIKHNDSLMSVYSNISDVAVEVGYKVGQGEIIATSSNSMINSDFENTLHFEVYYKGEVLDPENLYTLTIADFR